MIGDWDISIEEWEARAEAGDEEALAFFAALDLEYADLPETELGDE